MKLSLRLAPLALAASALLAISAHAQTVINFDDLPGNQTPIPNGYGGLNWNNLWDTTPVGAGYDVGDASPPVEAYNAFGDPAGFSSATPFTLDSIDMTSAFSGSQSVTMYGYDASNNVIDSKVVVLNDSAPTTEVFDWAGISAVGFSTGGQETQIILDNVTIGAAAPDAASTVMMLGAGLAGLAALRRRKL